MPEGLAARPGPTDWLNLGKGVGGVKFVEFWVATLSPPDMVDIVGVSGNELADVGGDSRLIALDRGKKIPAPDTVVLK